MIRRMRLDGTCIFGRTVGRKISCRHGVLVLVSVAWRRVASVHSRLRSELISSIAAVVCVVRLYMVLWGFILDHLVGTGADPADRAVFALDHFAKGVRAAPAEEEEGTEEDCANARDHDTGYGAFAQAT